MTRSNRSQPGFFSRLGRAFANVVKVVLGLFLVVVIGAGAWLGVRELQRSIGVVAQRGDRNAQQIEAVRLTVAAQGAQSGRQEEEVDRLQGENATLQARLAGVQTTLEADRQRRRTVLATMQVRSARLLTHTQVLSGDVASLQEGLLSLQSDINTNGRTIDALGGDLDALRLDQETLSEEFVEVRREAGQLAEMRRALTLFRAWELVARARLRLLEGNAGLAEADVESALAVVNGLLAREGTTEEALSPVQQRLQLALGNLPGEPDTAARDLETAWEALDAQLVALLGIEPLAPTPTPAPTGTATPAPAPTVTPTPAP